MTAEATAGLIVLGVAFLLGVRSVYRLWALWLHDELTRRNPLLAAFAIIAFIITVASGFFGATSLRRVLGYEPLPYGPLVALVLAAIVLLIPVWLDLLISLVAREEEDSA
jgi:hypothetical protein